MKNWRSWIKNIWNTNNIFFHNLLKIKSLQAMLLMYRYLIGIFFLIVFFILKYIDKKFLAGINPKYTRPITSIVFGFAIYFLISAFYKMVVGNF
jgi:hypothetical protein